MKKIVLLWNRLSSWKDAWGRYLRLIPRPLAQGIMIALCLIILISWGIGVVGAPSHRVSPYVSLAPYGYPDTSLRIVYPARLYKRDDQGAVLTIYARASLPESQEITLILPSLEEAFTFVDAQGFPISGRLNIRPGYPEPLPYSVRLSAAQSPFSPGMLRGRTVRLVPLLAGKSEEAIPLPELGFSVRLEGGLEHAWREAAAWLGGWGAFIGIWGAILVLLGVAWRARRRRRRLAREQQLSLLYTRLRDAIKVEDWNQARARVEEIRSLSPSYRDLDHLEALINAEETAFWRREQLYMAGLRAYRERDWPQAVQAFQKIEEETPYYRDVRFLRRTAALYADLRSRDRSLRLQAAVQLGEVADLLDFFPLLQALGDKSREVADAAEASLAKIGPEAFDTLLMGLTAESTAVRERCVRLLQGMGQSIREELLTALHSPDPRVTSAVARLLQSLGARHALAQALHWIGPEHQAAVVEALIQENEAACEPLVEAMLTAPPSREQVFINALAALKDRVEIARYLETRIRSATEERHKRLLQRALAAPPQPFAAVEFAQEIIEPQAASEEPLEKVSPLLETKEIESEERSLVRRLFRRERH